MCHDFKNKAYFSKTGNLVALAGFGTLNGEIQIWRFKDFQQVGKAMSPFSSFFKWSSNGNQFLTATVYEKLKEQHRLSIFKSNGEKINNIKFEIPDLINVDFCP